MSGSLPLGRRTPRDWTHVERYPLLAAQAAAPAVVESTAPLPRWHWTHDQGREGSCVGHGTAMERAITNSQQNKFLGMFRFSRRYDPLDIWDEAKRIDDWPETNPGDDEGTSVRAAYDVMRQRGPRRIPTNGIRINSNGDPEITEPAKEPGPDLSAGATVNRWAQRIDEMRAALASKTPVVIGVNWYSNFDAPISFGGEKWIGRGDLGHVRGGHCVCIYGASDARAAFKIKNSWGKAYPVVWLPYATMERLLNEYGEAALVTDR